MAALYGRCTTGAVALTTATAKTCLQIVAAANQRARVISLSVSFDGATSTAVPAQLRITRQTSAGTFTNPTNAPAPNEKGFTETFQTNYQTVATAEPTTGDVVANFTIPQYSGNPYERDFNWPNELQIQGGGRLGFEVTATFSGSLNVRINALIEE